MHELTWQKHRDTPTTTVNVQDNELMLELNDLECLLYLLLWILFFLKGSGVGDGLRNISIKVLSCWVVWCGLIFDRRVESDLRTPTLITRIYHLYLSSSFAAGFFKRLRWWYVVLKKALSYTYHTSLRAEFSRFSSVRAPAVIDNESKSPKAGDSRLFSTGITKGFKAEA